MRKFEIGELVSRKEYVDMSSIHKFMIVLKYEKFDTNDYITIVLRSDCKVKRYFEDTLELS